MAKITKPKDKAKFFDSHIKGTEDFLQRSGIPAGVEHAAALSKIKKYYVTGGMSWTESLQAAVEEWKGARSEKQAKELAKANALEQAEDQKKYNAVLKSAANAAKAAAAAAKAADRATKKAQSDAAKAAKKTPSGSAATTTTPSKITGTGDTPSGSAAGGELGSPPPIIPSATDSATGTVGGDTEKKIGILQALLDEQKSMGGVQTELSQAVLGSDDKKGVRAQLEQLVVDSREQIGDQDDPENSANFEVIETALELAEAALRSKDRKQQISIYKQLKFIRQASEKTVGSKSEISKKLAEIIKPVEEILKKKTGFGSFAKERLTDMMKGMPASIAQHIPVVGGMLSGYLQEKQAGKEELESNIGSMTQGISRGGHRTGHLRALLEGRKQGTRSDSDGDGGLGAAGAAGGGGELGGIIGGAGLGGIAGGIIGGGGSGKADPKTLKQIAVDVSLIKKAILATLGPKTNIDDILGFGGADAAGAAGAAGGAGAADAEGGIASKAEGAAEDYVLSKGWKGAKNLAGKGWNGIKNMVGMGTGEAAATGAGEAAATGAGEAAGAGGGFFSKMWQGGKNLASKGVNVAKSAVSGIGDMAVGGVKSLEGVAGGAGKFFGKAVNVGKNLASAGGEMLGSGISAAKGAVGGVLETISSMSPVKQITSVISKSAGGVAKVVMSAPVLGAIISGIMSGAEIKGIKDDPELTAAEKKEKIGVKLMEMLGGMGGMALGTWLGGAGGAILGSAVPVLGTAAGGWLGTLVGGLGGEWVGKKIMGVLGESLGGKEIYDIAHGIPGIGSLIDVGDDKKEEPKSAGPSGDMDSLLGSTPEEKIESDKRTVTDVENALQKRKSTGQTVAPKMTGGETRTQTINGETTTQTSAPYAEYTAGTELSKSEMAQMDMSIGMGGFSSTNAETPGGEGINTLSIPDVKLEQYLKQKKEGISAAQETIGKISAPATPNTTLGAQTREMEAARIAVQKKEQANEAMTQIQQRGATAVGGNSQTNNRTTVNNFDSNQRTRNNESTLERMQRGSVI